ncbi:hypothetical protein BH09BAC1_BH09BAC1_03020 [soil metagenome]
MIFKTYPSERFLSHFIFKTVRPTKLTHNLLQAFRAVLADELAAIAFTEEELVWQANQQLPTHEQISYRTYQRYKACLEECHAEPCRSTEDQLQETDIPSPNLSPVRQAQGRLWERDFEAENAALVQDMYNTFRGALMKQKLALVRGIYEGQPNWRRYSWMLERKFPDFKLKMPEGRERETERRKSGDNQLTNQQITNQPTPKPEPTELEVITAKWNRLPREAANPWSQASNHYQFHCTPEVLRKWEEEMAEDEAKGYVNPYANLGYQPAICPEGVDYNTYENGWYTFYSMGKEKGPRLPIRLWACKQISRPPKDPLKELIWAEQEWERQHPGEPYTGEQLPIEAWPEYPWPERLPRTDPDDPERPYDPDRSVAHIRGRILGFSG